MVEVYIGRGIKEIMQELCKWMEEEGGMRNIIVGEHFNGRTGEDRVCCYRKGSRMEGRRIKSLEIG